MRHRPIGIGVQGLADAFMSLRLPFDSPEARKLNLQIFETIYHAAMESSCEMARDHKIAHPEEDGFYSSYLKNGGCPASKGQLQPDLWGVTPSDLWDWDALKAQIAIHGIRNSLVTAPMVSTPSLAMFGGRWLIPVAFAAHGLYESDPWLQRVLRALHLVCLSCSIDFDGA